MEDASSSSFEDEELTEFVQDPVEQKVIEEESVGKSESRGRGRPRIPEQWTRIISMDKDTLEAIPVHAIGPDLLLASAQGPQPSKRRDKHWKPFFCPRTFVKDNGELKLADYAITTARLRGLGGTITKLRAQLRLRASKVAASSPKQQIEDEQTVRRHAKKVRARGSEAPRISECEYNEGYLLDRSGIRTWRKVKRCSLTVAEKIQIVHEVIVNHEKYADVSLKYHISNGRISNLVTLARKNKAFLHDLMGRAASKEARSQVIEDKVTELVGASRFIDSVDTVRDALPIDQEKPFKNWEILHVMRSRLKMKYKKVVPMSIHANSEKNRVLRQQFAIKFIGILQSKSVIINVDESWIGMSDFR